MPTELVSPDQFLSRLSDCFAGPSTETVRLTHKRYTATDGEAGMDVDAAEQEQEPGTFMVLVRCSFGESKFSTRIPASSLPAFHARYGSLLKASMAPAMRKRDKKKEKARAEATARKRREAYEDVSLEGTAGKRGAGRRQREATAGGGMSGDQTPIEGGEAEGVFLVTPYGWLSGLRPSLTPQQRKVKAQRKKEAERERIESRAAAAAAAGAPGGEA